MLTAPCLALLALAAAGPSWPGEASEVDGGTRYDFTVDGRPAFVVVPQTPAAGSPWVWRARFPAFHAEADRLLLRRGFHVAYVDTDGMLGGPRAMRHWDAFHEFVTARGLSERVALEAVSRGGLFAYRWASANPQKVACVYADTPVCDFKSWPLGRGAAAGSPDRWAALLKEYGLTHEEALAFEGNPVDVLEPLAKAGVPLLHVISLNDRVVPPAENTLPLAERYRALGGSIEIIEVAEGTEESQGHHFPHPDPGRVADFIEKHAAAK